MMEGPWCHSVEKHEPASDIDTAVVDSLKVLDLERPIREADSSRTMPGSCEDWTCGPPHRDPLMAASEALGGERATSVMTRQS